MFPFPVATWNNAAGGGGGSTLTKAWSDTLTASESMAVEKRMPWSDTLTASESLAVVKLAAPSDLTATNSETPVCRNVLAWSDTATNETGWKIYRKVGAGSYSLLTTRPANTTGYTDTSLVASTTYTYKVVPYYTDADSTDVAGPESNEDSATTSASCGPS